MNSQTRIINASITIPDFSIAKHSVALSIHVLTNAMEPDSLMIVDSTKPKATAKMNRTKKSMMFSLGATWRKLHLVIDEAHDVLACELTAPDVGNTSLIYKEYAFE